MSRPEHVESYLLLIDDTKKTIFEGELHLCVNSEHDCWQSADSVPLETLKKLAVTSVAERRKTTPSEEPEVTPEMRAFFKLYGV